MDELNVVASAVVALSAHLRSVELVKGGKSRRSCSKRLVALLRRSEGAMGWWIARRGRRGNSCSASREDDVDDGDHIDV